MFGENLLNVPHDISRLRSTWLRYTLGFWISVPNWRSYYFLRTVDFIWSRFMLQFNIMPCILLPKSIKLAIYNLFRITHSPCRTDAWMGFQGVWEESLQLWSQHCGHEREGAESPQPHGNPTLRVWGSKQERSRQNRLVKKQVWKKKNQKACLGLTNHIYKLA